ncbi:unnamed protein product [Musa acuminata subsp. burmannicoides]
MHPQGTKAKIEFVACTASGVWFVEASADCTLEDVNRLQRPLSIPAAEQVCYLVTQFRCGGFAVGIRFNHAVFDGVGAGQFFKAVGEMVQGSRPRSRYGAGKPSQAHPRPLRTTMIYHSSPLLDSSKRCTTSP